MKRLFSLALLAGLIAGQCLAVGISVQGHTADKGIKRLYLFMVQDATVMFSPSTRSR